MESVLEQVRQGLRVGQVVHRDEVDVLVSQGGAHDIAPDAPESIDANFHGHDVIPPRALRSDRMTAAGMSAGGGARAGPAAVSSSGDHHLNPPAILMNALRGVNAPTILLRDQGPSFSRVYGHSRDSPVRDACARLPVPESRGALGAHVSHLQHPARPHGHRRLAMVRLAGAATPEVRWQRARASRLPSGLVQPRRRAVDLGARGLGRRGARRPSARRVPESALSRTAAVPVDDDASPGSRWRAASRTPTACSISLSTSPSSCGARSTSCGRGCSS